jgi:hypothetical protein
VCKGLLGRETAAKAKAKAPASLGSRWAAYQSHPQAAPEEAEDDEDDSDDGREPTISSPARLGLGTLLPLQWDADHKEIRTHLCVVW